MSDDLKDRLNQNRQEQEWATTWEPGRGEILTGTLEKMDSGMTEYGEYPIANIRDEDGELWGVWLFHTVLQDQWEKADPEPGDKVGILYYGKRSGSTHDYHHYDVEVEPRPEKEPEDRSPQHPDDSALNGREKAERLYGDEETEDRPEPTMEDPNADLPY